MGTIGPSVPLLSHKVPADPPIGEPRNRGRFVPGNVAALKHGLKSRRVLAGLMPEQAEARAALRVRVDAIVRDLGGTDALSALAVGQVQRHARLELVDDYLWHNLQRHGPLTGKGATRAALTSWLQVVDRLQRSATTLGLARQAKPVQTLDNYLATRYGRQGEAQQPADAEAVPAGDDAVTGHCAAPETVGDERGRA